jgi:hypothetical protein
MDAELLQAKTLRDEAQQRLRVANQRYDKARQMRVYPMHRRR